MLTVTLVRKLTVTHIRKLGDTIRKLTVKITVKLQWPHLTSSTLSKNVISDLFDFLLQSDPDSDKLEMLLARRMRWEDWTALLTYVSNSILQVVNRFAITAGGEEELSSRLLLQDCSCSWTYKVLADGCYKEQPCLKVPEAIVGWLSPPTAQP